MTAGDDDPLDGLEEPAAAIAALFGERLELARTYAHLLATDGVVQGLIGPREVPRLWDRHLANCALVAELLPVGARVVDVGTGAGLPGIPLAIRRPDLQVDLVEPMLRRTNFLDAAVTRLGLTDRIRVVRGRADEPAVRRLVGQADWVVARAVAPLDRLVRWCLPLLGPNGTLLAMKGSSAHSEVVEHSAVLAREGVPAPRVVELGGDGLSPTWVVLAARGADRSRSTSAPRSKSKGKR